MFDYFLDYLENLFPDYTIRSGNKDERERGVITVYLRSNAAQIRFYQEAGYKTLPVTVVFSAPGDYADGIERAIDIYDRLKSTENNRFAVQTVFNRMPASLGLNDHGIYSFAIDLTLIYEENQSTN